MSKSKQDETPVVVAKVYDFVLWLLPKVENFDRAYRFTVGERLTAHGIDLMTTLVEAAYSRDKEVLLQDAGRQINSTRYLLRLAKDLKLMKIDRMPSARRNWTRSAAWWVAGERLRRGRHEAHRKPVATDHQLR